MKRLLKNLQTRISAFLHRESGEALIIIALSMAGLLGMCAMSVDLGSAYVSTAQLQTAADAAVMAAGLLLPVSASDVSAQTEILDTAREYLAKNGVADPDSATVRLGELSGGKYNTIYVSVPAVSETGFARVFGINEITFRREAEARTIPCTQLSDVVPLSIQKSKLDGISGSVVLKYGKKTDDVVGGSFGAIDLDGVKGGGANDYTNWLNHGYSGQLTVGSVLPVESGNMAGPTLSGISARYNACTHFRSSGGCTPEHYDPACPRVMKVPVVEYTDNSAKNVRLLGFAAFVLEDYNTYASQGFVIGSYVDMVNIGAVNGDISGSAGRFGVYCLTLSK